MKRNKLICYCGCNYGDHGFKHKKCQVCECTGFKAAKYMVETAERG